MKPDFRRLAMLAIALLFGLVWWTLARAEQPAAPRSLDDEALEIAEMLQCPICQNVPVAYSPSPLAGQMREVIRKKLEAGESRQQIIQYFVDRYGESILMEPSKRGFNLVVWRLPFLAVVVGATGIYLLVRQWSRVPPPPEALPPVPDDEVAAYEARLAAALWDAEEESGA
ncbi:MAG: cytochrome c-type biogenesis protein CcmH [Ardenticatenaceae bacterium]|nr:cytochrome c-type biogenesis protein CcmH [Ardenticatenaceae bacterium]